MGCVCLVESSRGCLSQGKAEMSTPRGIFHTSNAPFFVFLIVRNTVTFLCIEKLVLFITLNVNSKGGSEQEPQTVRKEIMGPG